MTIRSRLSRRGSLGAALVMLAAGLVATAPPGAARNADPLCSPERASTTHVAGGNVLQRKPLRIPCASETGYYTGETTIGVTSNGSVWFSAADWEWALVRTQDNGKTWERITPGGPQAMPGCYIATSPATCQDTQAAKNGTVADGFLWVDPTTSKVFWSKTYGLAVCSSLSMTPDDGKTWPAVPEFACPGADYEKIAGGPAPEGGEQPVGYPNVLYGCTNGPVPFFVVGPSRACYKSLDGGREWTFAGAPVPSPLAPGCLHFQEPQAVGPDGTLYVPLSCGTDNPAGLVKIARSHDEGTTWEYRDVPAGEVGNSAGFIGGVSLAVDEGGNVYVVWRGADSKPYLAISKDQGNSWTAPLMVGMPGVTSGGPTPQVAARRPGHVAIGYYGHTGDPEVLSGYLTESFDATAATPIFYSALLNDPKDPLYFPTDGGTLPRNDYLGVAIGPDGTPWVGLVKLKSATSDSEGFIQSTGYAARLARR
jgi:hypothetical protein